MRNDDDTGDNTESNELEDISGAATAATDDEHDSENEYEGSREEDEGTQEKK